MAVTDESVVATGMRAQMTEAAFLSVKDLTARWQVSRSVAYKTVASEGFPPALKFGSTLRFSRAKVEEWEASQMAGQQ